MRHPAKKIAFLGLCTSVALVLAYVESLLPPLFAAVPGIKLGLPNIALIFLLYRFGVKEAAAVSFVRMVAVALLFGNPMTFAYSLAGGFLSLTAMAILRKLDFLSVVGVSVAISISSLLSSPLKLPSLLLKLKVRSLRYCDPSAILCDISEPESLPLSLIFVLSVVLSAM